MFQQTAASFQNLLAQEHPDEAGRLEVSEAAGSPRLLLRAHHPFGKWCLGWEQSQRQRQARAAGWWLCGPAQEMLLVIGEEPLVWRPGWGLQSHFTGVSSVVGLLGPQPALKYPLRRAAYSFFVLWKPFGLTTCPICTPSQQPQVTSERLFTSCVLVVLRWNFGLFTLRLDP